MSSLLRMKLIVPIILIVGTIFFYGKAKAEEHFPFIGKINSDGINVRAGANTNFERIDQLPLGTLVVVYAHQFEWYQIQLLSTAQVYIRSDYLTVLGQDVAQVKGDRVNLRARPNSESAVLGQLTADALVRVVANVDGWSKVVAPKGVTGWVNQKFVTITDQVVDDNVLPKPVLIPSAEKVVATDVKAKELVEKSDDAKKPAVQIVVEGYVRPAFNAPKAEVRYQVFVNDKPMYYLIEAPDLGQFASRKVKVTGILVKEGSSQDLPILKVTNIALVM